MLDIYFKCGTTDTVQTVNNTQILFPILLQSHWYHTWIKINFQQPTISLLGSAKNESYDKQKPGMYVFVCTEVAVPHRREINSTFQLWISKSNLSTKEIQPVLYHI